MDRFVELGSYMDCYGALLTERQASIMSQYAYENCSLAEIAERESISRQGVRDILVRAEQQLRQYEEKLHMSEKLLKTRTAAEECKRTVTKLELCGNDRERVLRSLERIERIWEDDDGV
ncbi:MAG: sigma factor-like helix-turn-helix DNA-binding protein [Clostridia bacterium]|nr:sigma factor-like helix-turn-helix DNA-binding protein [Clostridia bacterium]